MGKHVLFDRLSSNNAARLRLWILLKDRATDFEVRLTRHEDQSSEGFLRLNPLGKVPLLVLPDGTSLPESGVILQYLEDKYPQDPVLVPATPEDRAHMRLVMQVHDLYLASPNGSQPGFTHTQGGMYLGPQATQGSPAGRVIDRPTRAAKLAEIWKQLDVLEGLLRSPFFCGGQMTLADLTVYPTFVFFRFMLPHVFRWPDVFHGRPKLRQWVADMEQDPHVRTVQVQLQATLDAKAAAGWFEAIIAETRDPAYKWQYP